MVPTTSTIPVLLYPEPAQWPALCARPNSGVQDLQETYRSVEEIVQQVQQDGDAALRRLTFRFDGVLPDDFRPTEAEWQAAGMIDEDLRRAIETAAGNIRAFHAAQADKGISIETVPGVRCWRRSVPVERVGLYVPGGSAPLFSTLLMLGIPATLAGCRQIVVVTPPGPDGSVDPAILYAAQCVGIRTLYKVGGAQAIAALAYGTESIPAVDKIFGPGNRYVTAAKMLAQSRGIAVDLPAGPSEVLVIADESCTPAFVAADLLSQAEHGPDSQVVLVTTSPQICTAIAAALVEQLAGLPRKEIAGRAIADSKGIVVRNLEQAMEFSNAYAPEHLILAVENPQQLAEQVVNAGSVFLGHYTPESLGDYASGTNHTLPTNGFARSYSGVSLDSFVKKITFQQATPQGLQLLGPAVELMAEAEALRGHATAVAVRLAAISAGQSVEADQAVGRDK